MSSYKKYRETADHLEQLAMAVVEDADAPRSRQLFATEGLYRVGMLRGLMIAGEPVDSPTMHRAWSKTARAINDLRRTATRPVSVA